MKKLIKLKVALADENGATAPLLGLFIVIFLIFLAFAVDLGRLYIVKNELQNAADAAALAGARELYQTSQLIDAGAVNTAAQNCALQNKSLGVNGLNAAVEIGKWNFATQTFTPIPSPTYTTDVNAVRTTVRRLGDDGSGVSNSTIGTAFAGVMGVNQLGTQATAVAYLGITSSNVVIDIPFALPDSFIVEALKPEPRDSLWGLLTPTPAYAAVSRTLVWKDLGGTPSITSRTLETSRGAWVDSDSSPDFTSVKNLIIGTSKFPKKKVGDVLYPMSEANWPSNTKAFFQALKTRYLAKKDPSTNKWRVTVAIFDRYKPTAAKPSNPWYLLALKAPFMVAEAQACTSLSSPEVYIDGFASIDITGVNYNSSCTSNSLDPTNPASCPHTNYMTIEIPLDQNFQYKGAEASGTNFERTYKAMNSGAYQVGMFNPAPKIVK